MQWKRGREESKAQEGWVMHNTVNLLPTDAPSMSSSNWCLLTHFPQFLRWAWHSVVCNLSLACSGQLSHPCLSPVSCAPFTARVLKSPWSVVITGQTQPAHQYVIIIIPVLNPKDSSAPATWKKSNSLPAKI